jgi:hypothetical protein
MHVRGRGRRSSHEADRGGRMRGKGRERREAWEGAGEGGRGLYLWPQAHQDMFRGARLDLPVTER